MPTKNPRINVVLDKPLYKNVQFLAKKEGVSLSTKLRDLIRDALEIQEDLQLTRMAEKREKSFNESTALTHEQVWT
ncbi:MAG: toxin-antitoxin system, antitoxin component [Deltaproteobacteria bacterium]|nr:toxin-antitoxin system, antitoxin component [Deltaproteobacteria bacterium]